MPIRRLRTFNNNKRTLLDNVGYRSIRSFRNDNPEYRNNNQAYTALLQLYNEEVDRLNAEEERIKREEARLKKEQTRLRRQQARLQRRNITQYYKEKKENYDYSALYKFTDVATKIAKKDEEKYNTTQGVFIREVKVSYDCRQKSSQTGAWLPPFRASRSELVIASSMVGLDEASRRKGINLRKGLEEVSPELNDNFNITYGRVYNSSNRVPVEQIRMRNTEPLKLDGIELSEWDMGTGRCVYDALISLWEQPNSKMGKKANYDWLDQQFISYENPNPFEDGVNINELYALAVRERFSMYAFNINDKLIKKHTSTETRNSKKPPLIFRLYNNHIYTIDDKEKQASLIAKNRNGEKVRHNQLKDEYGKKEKKDQPTYKNVIADNQELTGNDFAVKYIFENKSIPFPMTKHNIKYDKGQIKQMTIGNNKVFTQPVENDITDYLKTNKLDYNGQHYITLLMEFWKETYEGELQDNELISEMNPAISDMLNMENVKNRVHIGSMMEIDDMDKRIDDGEIVGADVIKCYSSILDNPADNWLQYSITDEVKEYDFSDLQTGLYFVETSDLTILHGTNWYSNTILEYARNNKIDFKITKQYLPSQQKENKEYFKKMIDYVSSKCGMKLTKNIINSITGMLGKTKQSSYNTSISTDINEVWECLNANAEKVNDFFVKENTYEDKVLYIYGFKNKSEIHTNNLPMYIQILDQSNIKLHQLQMKLGGELLYRKTDAVVVLGGKNIVESDKTLRSNWGKETILSKEEMKLYHYDYRANQYRGVESIEHDGWNFNKDFTTSSQYKDIIDYAVENGGLLVCSRAGTGKSYMVQQGVKDKLIDDDKRCRLAFTNKASRNINGSTIHSAISINADTEKASVKMVEAYKGKKIIIVDEVSMISKQLWTYLILLKRVSGATFILLGDYRQLPAVENVEHDYFDSSIMRYLTNSNRIELTERQRYDKQLWDWLDDFYNNGIVGDALEKIKPSEMDMNAYNICYYNKTRERINMKYMIHHKNNNAMLLPHEKKDCDDRADSVYIYEGLPVMAIVNKIKAKKGNENDTLFCNSDTMKVIKYNEEQITFKLDIPDDKGNDILTIQTKDFHKSFVANYCSTTHKNQGATIDKNIQLWDWGKMKEDRRIGYTAVSRAKKIQQVKIVV